MSTRNILFRNKEHKDFYTGNLEKCIWNDGFHQALIYLMGISEQTRRHINDLFDFEEDRVKHKGLHADWQTDSTSKICHLAFNLWNGYVEEGKENDFTPFWIFGCSYVPYFLEAIKLWRDDCDYPVYCHPANCKFATKTEKNAVNDKKDNHATDPVTQQKPKKRRKVRL